MSGAGLPLTRGSSFASGSWLDALGRTRVIVGYLFLLSFLVVYGFHSARVALNAAVDELRTRQTTFARDVGTLRDSIARTQNDVVAVAAGLQHVNEVLESIGRKLDALEESRAVEHLGSRTLALEGRMESSENMVRHLAQDAGTVTSILDQHRVALLELEGRMLELFPADAARADESESKSGSKAEESSALGTSANPASLLARVTVAEQTMRGFAEQLVEIHNALATLEHKVTIESVASAAAAQSRGAPHRAPEEPRTGSVQEPSEVRAQSSLALPPLAALVPDSADLVESRDPRLRAKRSALEGAAEEPRVLLAAGAGDQVVSETRKEAEAAPASNPELTPTPTSKPAAQPVPKDAVPSDYEEEDEEEAEGYGDAQGSHHAGGHPESTDPIRGRPEGEATPGGDASTAPVLPAPVPGAPSSRTNPSTVLHPDAAASEAKEEAPPAHPVYRGAALPPPATESARNEAPSS